MQTDSQRTINLLQADRNEGVFCGNHIRTSKYSLLTFLPLNLLNQYKKAANIYFTIIAYMQTVDLITITAGKAVMVIPLSVVIAISMIKDAWEDHQRSTADRAENG